MPLTLTHTARGRCTGVRLNDGSRLPGTIELRVRNSFVIQVLGGTEAALSGEQGLMNEPNL